MSECSACPGCAARDLTIAERDRTIADQARTLERVTAELRWHGLDDDALTVEQGFELYQRARLADRSWPRYRQLLAHFVRHLGKLPCLQVTAERWAEHRAVRATEKGGLRGRSLPTSGQLDQELGLAKMMFRWLARAGKLPRNPLDLAKKRNEPSGRETYLEETDVQKLIAGADVLAVSDRGYAGQRYARRAVLFRAWVAVKFGAGLRFEEARPLRRDRIAPDGTVELSAKVTKGKRRRTFALTEQALELVRAVPQLAHEPHVFSVHRGGVVRLVGSQTLRGWFHRVCEHTGVDSRAVDGERVVPHVLRHSAASHLEAQGAHPMEIKEFLDHESLSTTEKYLHRRPAQRARRMAALMSSKTGAA